MVLSQSPYAFAESTLARTVVFSRLDWGGSVSQLMHMVVDRVQGLAVDWPETPLP